MAGCGAATRVARLRLGTGHWARQFVAIDGLVTWLGRFVSGGDLLTLSYTCTTNRRALHRLDLMPLGRLHRGLAQRALSKLPALLRATPGSKLVGGFVLQTLVNADPTNAAWAGSDVDLAVPEHCLWSTLDALVVALASGDATDIAVQGHHPPTDQNHVTITYAVPSRNPKSLVQHSLDVFGRPGENWFPSDLPYLYNDYDGRVLRVDDIGVLHQHVPLGSWDPLSGAGSTEKCWARILKYRRRGFPIASFLQSLADYEAYCTSIRRQRAARSFRDPYTDRDPYV